MKPEDSILSLGDGVDTRHTYADGLEVTMSAGFHVTRADRADLPDDVTECPLCGQQKLHGHNVEVGDDDSVSVDDIIGLFAPHQTEPRECLCMLCGVEYPAWYAPNDLWNAVVRLPDGSDEWPFLCPTCFARKAVECGAGGIFSLSVPDR